MTSQNRTLLNHAPSSRSMLSSGKSNIWSKVTLPENIESGKRGRLEEASGSRDAGTDTLDWLKRRRKRRCLEERAGEPPSLAWSLMFRGDRLENELRISFKIDFRISAFSAPSTPSSSTAAAILSSTGRPRMTDDRNLKSFTVSLPFLVSKFNKLRIIPEGQMAWEECELMAMAVCFLLPTVLSVMVDKVGDVDGLAKDAV